MGSECSFCEGDKDSMQQASPDRTPFIREHTKQNEMIPSRSFESSSDSDYAQFNMDQLKKNNAALSMLPTQYNDTGNQQTINAFKQAIEKGLESLAMYYAEEYPKLDLFSIRFNNGDTCLHKAVQNKAYNLIFYLLSQGASPNDQNSQNGDTSLHIATRIGDIKTITILSRYGADLYITNNQRETAVSIAMENNDDDIIELLTPETHQLFIDNENSQTPRSMMQSFAADILLHVDTDKSIGAINGMTESMTVRINNVVDDVLIEEIDESVRIDSLIPKSQQSEINDSQQIDYANIKTVRNPFGKLKGHNTKQLLCDINRLDSNKKELVKLETWLDKKQHIYPYGWQRRWVVVKDSHLLWSEHKICIKNSKNKLERDKFNNCVNLMSITKVDIVEKSKTKRKFVITTQQYGKETKTREYIWKAQSVEERDHWVKGLKQHIQYIKSMVLYLGTHDLDQ